MQMFLQSRGIVVNYFNQHFIERSVEILKIQFSSLKSQIKFLRPFSYVTVEIIIKMIIIINKFLNTE